MQNLQSYAFSSLYGQLISTRIGTAAFYAHAERSSHFTFNFRARFKTLGTPFATTFLAYKALKGGRGIEWASFAQFYSGSYCKPSAALCWKVIFSTLSRDWISRFFKIDRGSRVVSPWTRAGGIIVDRLASFFLIFFADQNLARKSYRIVYTNDCVTVTIFSLTTCYFSNQ